MSRFQTTRWSLIAAAATEAAAPARPALEQLCRAYRPPVLAYVRRCGHSGADAEDLVQAFFLHFLERAWYVDADPQRGRFRNLLLVSLRRFLADQQLRETAQKRNGRARADTDALDALADAGETPEQAFHRTWLATVLARAITRLHREWQVAGKQSQFAALAPLLVEAPDAGELQAAASQLGLHRNTMAVQLHRMRVRLRQLTRLELLQTVDSREALEAELLQLQQVIAGSP